jgi:hypothetical protein
MQSMAKLAKKLAAGRVDRGANARAKNRTFNAEELKQVFLKLWGQEEVQANKKYTAFYQAQLFASCAIGAVTGRRGGDFFNIFMNALYPQMTAPEDNPCKLRAFIVSASVSTTKEGKAINMHFMDHSDFRRCPLFAIALVLHFRCSYSSTNATLIQEIIAALKLRSNEYVPGDSPSALDKRAAPAWWSKRLLSSHNNAASVRQCF